MSERTSVKKSIPPADQPPSSKLRPSSRGAPVSGLSRKLRVLVVDDSAICLEAAAMMLEEHGYDVKTADSPFAVSAALTEYAPDLVLVDVTMPGLSGDKVVEFAVKHRHARRPCPIVLHSDRSEAELAQLAADCGAAGYIHKTSNADRFMREIERFLPFPPGR